MLYGTSNRECQLKKRRKQSSKQALWNLHRQVWMRVLRFLVSQKQFQRYCMSYRSSSRSSITTKVSLWAKTKTICARKQPSSCLCICPRHFLSAVRTIRHRWEFRIHWFRMGFDHRLQRDAPRLDRHNVLPLLPSLQLSHRQFHREEREVLPLFERDGIYIPIDPLLKAVGSFHYF